MDYGATAPSSEHEPPLVGGALAHGLRRTSSYLTELPAGWRDTNPHPWRRYFARGLDIVISGVAVEVAVIWVSSLIDPTLGARVSGIFGNVDPRLVDMGLVAFAVIPNAVMIGLTGTSPGKWIFGVRVLNAEGRPMGILRGLERELWVLMFGVAFGIPLIFLLTLILSCVRLEKREVTIWDSSMELVIAQRPNHLGQVCLSVFGVCAQGALVAVVGAYAATHGLLRI